MHATQLMLTSRLEAYCCVMAVNLDVVFFAMQKQIPAIIASGDGASVNVTRVDAETADTCTTPPTRQPGTPSGLTPIAATWDARTGVRINERQPGVIATELSKTDQVGTAVAHHSHPPSTRKKEQKN